jgi:hypothetical protein
MNIDTKEFITPSVTEAKEHIQNTPNPIEYSETYDANGEVTFTTPLEVKNEYGYSQYQECEYKGKDALELMLCLRKTRMEKAKKEYDNLNTIVKIIEKQLKEYK